MVFWLQFWCLLTCPHGLSLLDPRNRHAGCNGVPSLSNALALWVRNTGCWHGQGPGSLSHREAALRAWGQGEPMVSTDAWGAQRWEGRGYGEKIVKILGSGCWVLLVVNHFSRSKKHPQKSKVIADAVMRHTRVPRRLTPTQCCPLTAVTQWGHRSPPATSTWLSPSLFCPWGQRPHIKALFPDPYSCSPESLLWEAGPTILWKKDYAKEKWAGF